MTAETVETVETVETKETVETAENMTDEEAEAGKVDIFEAVSSLFCLPNPPQFVMLGLEPSIHAQAECDRSRH